MINKIKKTFFLLFILSFAVQVKPVHANEDKTYDIDKNNRTISIYSEGVAMALPNVVAIELSGNFAGDMNVFFNKFSKDMQNRGAIFLMMGWSDEAEEITTISMIIVFDNIDVLNNILDAAMEYGFNESYKLTFYADATNKAYEEALLNTSKNAKNKANDVLKIFSAKAKDLISVEETNPIECQSFQVHSLTYKKGQVINPNDYLVELKAYAKVTYTF